MVISGSSNTSSGHSSLSTEGENRSSSASDRDTSRDISKRLPSRPSDVGGPVPALLLLGEQRNTDKLTLKARKIRQPRSMESLLQSKDQRLKLAATPLGKGIGGGSTGNVSVVSVGTTFQQQHYQRHRSKYGHVQSKVKQMIEEMKPPPASGRDRKTLVRHKSMPETSYDADSKDEVRSSAVQWSARGASPMCSCWCRCLSVFLSGGGSDRAGERRGNVALGRARAAPAHEQP